MSRLFRPCLLAFLVLGVLFGKAEGADRYGMVADAGSTGTRMYLFHIPEGSDKVDVKDLGKGPALSSFRERPEDAVHAVKQKLEQAAGYIPEALRRTVPVSVLATAGMRLVPKEEQDAIYAALTEGLARNPDEPYMFDAARFEARTISGREEGVFALLAANYLSKHVGVSLQAHTGTLMGVLDLGGSSTQVAAPPSAAAGDQLKAKLGEEHTFVRSFLNLGMERMRNRTWARFVEQGDPEDRARGDVPNPCAFKGYSEASEVWLGSGEASACEAKIKAVLQEERIACFANARKPDQECLSADPVPLPKGAAGAAKFYLISGYMYVTDFAAWLVRQTGARPGTEMTSPTIAEMREVAAAICGQDWAGVESLGKDPEKKHKFTQPHKLPHRCFELNYIVALLSHGYGFKEDERLFSIVDEIDGGEIEWTLGAFLHALRETTEHNEL